MKISGDEELKRALKAFPDKLEKRVLRSAAGKAATATAKGIRREAKPASPTIARFIGTKVKLYKQGTVFAIAGPRRDSPKSPTGHNPAYTAHLVDRGTKPHSMKAWGRVRIVHPGAKAQPFMQPGAHQATSDVKRIYLQALRDGIAKITKELS
jgi:hypothetical protein